MRTISNNSAQASAVDPRRYSILLLVLIGSLVLNLLQFAGVMVSRTRLADYRIFRSIQLGSSQQDTLSKLVNQEPYECSFHELEDLGYQPLEEFGEKARVKTLLLFRRQLDPTVFRVVGVDEKGAVVFLAYGGA